MGLGLELGDDGNQALPPERSDWDRVLDGFETIGTTHGRTIAFTHQVYVVKPGRISKALLLREPGVCLARTINLGEEVLDVLRVSIEDCESIEVYSQRQCGGDDRVLLEDAFRVPNAERDKWTRVVIGGRVAAWGSLGDDTYESDWADSELAKMLIEVAFEVEGWNLAPIYYETYEEPAESRKSRREPIARIIPADYFRLEDYQPWVFGAQLRAIRAHQ